MKNLFNILEKEGIKLGGKEKELLVQYADLIKKFSKSLSLVSRKDLLLEVEKQLFDAVVLSKFIGDFSSLVDLGAGAGFVGIVQKILFPHAQIYLVERRKKRVAFLEVAIKYLGLEGIHVLDVDWKELRLEADIAVSKASCGIDELVRLLPFIVRKDGILIHFSSSRDLMERANRFYYYYSPYRETQQLLYVFQRTI